ncbi:MAG: HDOD domain-containing protein [Fibrobacteres bacterium]|nr:HDOD domain-containing protein [Fibrobacterota bacterium]
MPDNLQPYERRTTAQIGKAQKLRFIAEKIIALPTLPTVVSRLMQLVDSPKSSAQTLAKLIENDQVLTARILKLANSAYYGMARQVATVSQAVVIVGFDAVKDMGLSVSVLDAFKDPGGNRYFNLARFWEHTMGVAFTAKLLAKKHAPEVSSEAFTAGLLHDLGKVVINQYCHDDFMEIMSRVNDDKEDLLYAETMVLDTTHDRIGGWLANRWNMPVSIVDAIEFHHHPYLSEKHQTLATLIKLADVVCRRANIGYSGNNSPAVLSEEEIDYLTKINVPTDDETLKLLEDQARAEMDKAGMFIEIIRQ